jgi:hypothetical protein
LTPLTLILLYYPEKITGNQNKFVGSEVINVKMLDKAICVISPGYIGLPTASLLGTKSFQVYGVGILNM